MSVNLEIQWALRSPWSVPYYGDECFAKLAHAGVAGVFDVSFCEHDTKRLPSFPPTEGMGAEAVATEPELRLLVHLDLGDHPAGRGIQPGDVDAGCLADQAASSVAADEVLRSERRVPGQLDIHAGVILSEAHHLAAARAGTPSSPTQPARMGSNRLCPQSEDIVVAGGEVADVQEDPGVAQVQMHLPRRVEPFRDATLIEHLGGAGVETPRSRSVEILTGASFDDDDVDPRQRQLARQHHPVGPPPAIATACSVIAAPPDWALPWAL